jgi:hypothetical protein
VRDLPGGGRRGERGIGSGEGTTAGDGSLPEGR